jgi:S1-C subfamily serine protease
VRLVFETGSLAGKGVELPYAETLVGRADDCQLVLGDPGVSGHHAEIRVLGESHATIEDLGSRNGTFADGERISGVWNLTPGTELRFGPVVATLTEGARSPESRGSSRLPIVVATLALLVAAAAVALVATGAVGGNGGDGRAAQGPASTPTATPTPTPTPTATPFTRQDAIRRARRSTVLVSVDGIPNGSGWVVDTGKRGAWIVTNEHVVAGASTFAVNLDGEEPRAATLIGASACDDLALLRVDGGRRLRPLPLGDEPEQGDDLLVMGFPQAATDDIALQVKRASVARTGASLKREDRPADAVYRDLIQVDGAVIPGNSGGPLIAVDDGSVVGVNSLSEDIQGRETVGYAITAARVEKVLEYLVDGTSVPGMSLAFPEDGSAPVVVGVTSPTLIRRGVVPDGTQQVISVAGKEFGTELEPSMRGLCGELPELGDGVGTPVAYRFLEPDGTTFRATLEY